MKKALKIGIVGCGAIGSSLAKSIVKDFSQEAQLCALYDINQAKADDLARSVSGRQKLVVENLQDLIALSELVIEAASAMSARMIAERVLKKGRDIMLMSVGGIVACYQELANLAKKQDARIYIPSGAISGIDALKAASRDKIKRVTLISRKNPASFRGVPYLKRSRINLDKIKKETLLFSGKARDAVKFFPQNINVAAVLSIAGIGDQKTKVKIIASPKIKKNIHEIKIEAQAATITTRTENILHPENPKTSFLAVLSAIATLKQILDPVKIGT